MLDKEKRQNSAVMFSQDPSWRVMFSFSVSLSTFTSAPGSAVGCSSAVPYPVVTITEVISGSCSVFHLQTQILRKVYWWLVPRVFGVNHFHFSSCRKQPGWPSRTGTAKHPPSERWLEATEWWWERISTTFSNGKHRGMGWNEHTLDRWVESRLPRPSPRSARKNASASHLFGSRLFFLPTTFLLISLVIWEKCVLKKAIWRSCLSQYSSNHSWNQTFSRRSGNPGRFSSVTSFMDPVLLLIHFPVNHLHTVCRSPPRDHRGPTAGRLGTEGDDEDGKTRNS